MLRIRLGAATIALLGLTVGAEPAAAQFGGLFGGPPPRPPSGVPNQAAPAQPQQTSPPPQRSFDPLASQNGDSVQSQPLPPTGSDPRTQPRSQPPAGGQPSVAGLPPNQGQLRGTTPATAAAPPPNDEVITELPSQKIANPTAVFAGLDKITGRIISFDVAINETVQFGALRVTPRVCYTRPPTETSNTDGFVEVEEVTLQGEVKHIFGGWMFASSPGLHAVEHPIYDVWLTDCKGAPQAVAATQPTTPTTATPTTRTQTQRPPSATAPQAPRPQQQVRPLAPAPPPPFARQ
jgi:hypothetical protein